MRFTAVVLEVEAEAADAFTDALLAQGALSATIEDVLAGTPIEQPVFDEPGGGPGLGWKRARIRALLAGENCAAGVVNAVSTTIGLKPPAFSVEAVPAEEDWVANVQSQFAPFQISDRLWIVPSWCSAPVPTALNITLDPGRAFGTGSHPTTKACLQWLDRRVFPAARVLDYGCGSGILAIAAMKLGAGSAVGVDTDVAALEVARGNAASNAVTVRLVRAEDPLDFSADLVVANILAGPLKMLAPVFASHCAPSGCIALAGILERQTTEVIAAYRRWFELVPFAVEDDWVALEGTRR